MSQEDSKDYYEIKTNFLEYGRIKKIVTEILSDKDIPIYNVANPQNSMINMIISLDRKCVSNMYKVFMADLAILYTISVRNVRRKQTKLNKTDVRQSFII